MFVKWLLTLSCLYICVFYPLPQGLYSYFLFSFFFFIHRCVCSFFFFFFLGSEHASVCVQALVQLSKDNFEGGYQRWMDYRKSSKEGQSIMHAYQAHTLILKWHFLYHICCHCDTIQLFSSALLCSSPQLFLSQFFFSLSLLTLSPPLSLPMTLHKLRAIQVALVMLIGLAMAYAYPPSRVWALIRAKQSPAHPSCSIPHKYKHSAAYDVVLSLDPLSAGSFNVSNCPWACASQTRRLKFPSCSINSPCCSAT